MTKYFSILTLIISLNCYSQTSNGDENHLEPKKNEFRIDIPHFAYLKQFQFSLERQVSNRFSVGLSSVLFDDKTQKKNYNNNEENFYNKYQIIPYVQYRISPKKNNIFYVEALSNINGGIMKNIEEISEGNSYYYDLIEKKYTNLGFGASVGFKKIFFERFVFNIYGGGVFNVNSSSKKNQNYVPRFGLELGYKF